MHNTKRSHVILNSNDEHWFFKFLLNNWISKWNLPDDNLDYFVVSIIKLFPDESKIIVLDQITLHAQIQKVLSGGSNSDDVVFVCFSGARLQRPPKVDHFRPASETPLEWRFAGGLIMDHRWLLTWQLCDFQVIRTSITTKPYKFVIFQVFPLWIRTCTSKSQVGYEYLVYICISYLCNSVLTFKVLKIRNLNRYTFCADTGCLVTCFIIDASITANVHTVYTVKSI